MNKLLLSGILAALLLVSGGIGAYFYFGDVSTTENAGTFVDDRPFIYVEVPPVVTNFDVKGKMRYLQITVSLQTRDAPTSDTFKANLPLIQSELLTLMQISQFDEITSTRGKTGFIKRIESNVRQLFKTGEDPIELERAMLTGFVIQSRLIDVGEFKSTVTQPAIRHVELRNLSNPTNLFFKDNHDLTNKDLRCLKSQLPHPPSSFRAHRF